MATAPTIAEVRNVIALPSSVLDATVQEFIDMAVVVVDGCASILLLPTTTQAMIVKWVAAHLLSGQYGRGGAVTQKSVGDASETYQSITNVGGIGLNSSFYGQQALLLDSTGCLARRGRAAATMRNL